MKGSLSSSCYKSNWSESKPGGIPKDGLSSVPESCELGTSFPTYTPLHWSECCAVGPLEEPVQCSLQCHLFPLLG